MDIKVDKGHYIVMLRGALPPKGILFIVHEHGLLFGLFFFLPLLSQLLERGEGSAVFDVSASHLPGWSSFMPSHTSLCIPHARAAAHLQCRPPLAQAALVTTAARP